MKIYISKSSEYENIHFEIYWIWKYTFLNLVNMKIYLSKSSEYENIHFEI